MAELLYEVWREEGDGVGRITCHIAGQAADDLRGKLEPHAVLLRTFWATSHEDAMRQHHAAQGWGEYKGIAGVTDELFSEEQASEQRAYLDRRG